MYTGIRKNTFLSWNMLVSLYHPKPYEFSYPLIVPLFKGYVGWNETYHMPMTIYACKK